MKKVQIVLEIAEEEKIKYDALAKGMQLDSVEELLLKLLYDMEFYKGEKIDKTMTYLLKKNQELYRRLA